MYRTPPEYQHNLLPDDILSPDDTDLLTRHYTAWDRLKPGEDPDNSINTKFSKQERSRAALLYEMLRDHGFYPARIGLHGRIKWGVQLKSPARIKLEVWCDQHSEISAQGSQPWAKRMPAGAV